MGRAAQRLAAVRIDTVDDMTPLDALKVGLVQCFAMIPGTSRSGATIIGGMLLGLSRKAATDFSFFLAIPTLIGAGAYSLYKERALLSMADLPMFAVGLAVLVHLGVVVRALAAALHRHPHLRGVCVVPHRLRHRRADHGLHRPRHLGGVIPASRDAAPRAPIRLKSVRRTFWTSGSPGHQLHVTKTGL